MTRDDQEKCRTSSSAFTDDLIAFTLISGTFSFPPDGVIIRALWPVWGALARLGGGQGTSGDQAT